MADKPKFKDLTRDVDWHRASFLQYCLKIAKSDTSDHGNEETVVLKILGGYLALALLFYKQFRDSLKADYEDPSTITSVSDVKLMMQAALDKLVEEWHRVYAIIASIRASTSHAEAKRLVDQMSSFVEMAMRDVDLSPNTFPIILQFGQSYSMRFSNYSDGFAALSIPMWVLQSPWEWTILWHELAGEKVRQLKIEEPDFFASQFDWLLQSLQDDRIAALDGGWSLDWVEELFEDSFSVLHFPIHFLFVFKNLLERYPDGGKDQRHPSRSLRLAVAMCLHLQRGGFTELPADIQQWSSTTWNKWIELLDEKKPDRFARFDPNAQLSNEVDIKAAWLTAQRIIEWHRSKELDQNNDNVYRKIISKAMIDYSRGDDRLQISEEAVNALPKVVPLMTGQEGTLNRSFNLLCDLINKGSLADLSDDNKGIILVDHPHVGELLNGLHFQQLLELSFSKLDLLHGDPTITATFTFLGTTYTIDSKKVADNLALGIFRRPASVGVASSDRVSFTLHVTGSGLNEKVVNPGTIGSLQTLFEISKLDLEKHKDLFIRS